MILLLILLSLLETNAYIPFSRSVSFRKERQVYYCNYQIENFIEHHAGTWAGLQIQTTHEDEDDDQQNPLNAPAKLLCGTSLLPKTDGSISHINFFVNKELDYQDNNDVIPSSSITSREVGIYSQQQQSQEDSPLPSKVCSAVLLGGPDSTADALSMQFSFAHKKSFRCRVLLSFETSSTAFIPNTSIEVPNAVALDTVSISREKRVPDDMSNFPPASEFVDLNSPMWREVHIDSQEFKTKFSNCSESIYKEGMVMDSCACSNELGLIEAYHENKIMESEFFSPEIDDDDDDDDDEKVPRFIKAYRGGLVIDSPLAINAGKEASVSIYWSIPSCSAVSGGDQEHTLYKATAVFSAMNSATNYKSVRKNGVQSIDQPVLDSFSVKTFCI